MTNPYELALEFVMDAVAQFLHSQGETRLPIVAEARGKREDDMLELAFSRIIENQASDMTAQRSSQLDFLLSFQSKKNNIIGVQMADLCAHPCARHILNPARQNQAYQIAHNHIYVGTGIRGWKVYP
jgi:hypothetical protein